MYHGKLARKGGVIEIRSALAEISNLSYLLGPNLQQQEKEVFSKWQDQSPDIKA
jgi:hypothetical protein